MGLRPTNGHESHPSLSFRESEAPHRMVQGKARNLLLIFFSQQQIPRRYASRNDGVVG